MCGQTLFRGRGEGVTLVLLAVMLVGGCQTREADEADHHVPEHKPVDYPAAVDRLHELHEQLLSQAPALDADAGATLTPLAEAHDIARWLAELAADSDLPEQPWNRVHESAARFQRLLAAMLPRERAEAWQDYQAQQQTVSELLQQLTEIQQLFPAQGEE